MNKAGFWTIEKALSRAEKYKTRKEMSKQDGGAYSFLRDKGLLGLLDPIIPSTKKNWSIETILITARLYEKREDFLKLNPSAYLGLVKRKVLPRLDEVFPPLKSKPRNYWTLDLILDIAKKYSTKKEFKRNNRCAYEALKNKKQTALLNKIFPDEIHKGYWMEKENVIKEARKCKTRTDFQKECSSAYSSAIKMGWLDEACSEMTSDRKPYGYWQNIKNVKLEIAKYKTLSDFHKNAAAAYNSVLKNRWHDLLDCLERKGNQYNRCIYVILSNKEKIAYVGLTYDFNKRMYSHKHSRTNKQATKLFLDLPDAEYVQITPYIDALEAKKLEAYYIDEYKSRGFTMVNLAKAGGLGSHGHHSPKQHKANILKAAKLHKTFKSFELSTPEKAKWFKSRCYKEGVVLFPCEFPCRRLRMNYYTVEVTIINSLLYETYSEVLKNKSLAYAVQKNKLQKRLRSLMPTNSNPPNYWTKKRVFVCAKECLTMGEFKKRHPSAHNRAQRERWLDEIASLSYSKNKRCGYWTKDRILTVANSCNTYSEFREKYKSGYTAALKDKDLIKQIKTIFLD